ncbi:MAG: hypothetical protein JWM74_1019 [Myxococcaceae bacterium]|nr:hypothetical protein [Myxococcaceae bacterium]
MWARLTEGEAVEGIEPFAFAEVASAFRAVFGSAMVIDAEATSIEGPGFELQGTSEPYLYVRCSFRLLETPQGEMILGQLREVASMLSATVFDPQTASAPTANRPAVEVDLAELGPTRTVRHAADGEDRAQSFARIDTWSVDAESGELGAAALRIHGVYLAQAGDGMSRQHSFHPTKLRDVACRYARVVQSALPFEIIVASGEGRADDGATVTFGNRVLAVVDGKIGFLLPPHSTLVREDGELVERWTAICFAPTGPLASRGGERTELTAIVARAANAALALAHGGNTRPLRDWLATMVTIAEDGLASEELFAGECAARGDQAAAFELYESGAAMPLWSGKNGGCVLEARLRIRDEDHFALTIVIRDRDVPTRPAFRGR